ncbi:vasotab-like [Thrips palmi]|uniref:Vasotab-like n=1 Tax=Thrips palmi TaxID=161013 RepID=A0A6P8ZHQ9_THRPL|nr:vasotab-like [Thrips palmi]
MKGLVAVLVLIGVAACVRADPVKGEKCPRVCPLNLAPVCGVQWGDRFQTFSNDCVRRSHNCQTKETFEFVCNGTCIYAPDDLTPKPRAGYLPASTLCRPWG